MLRMGGWRGIDCDQTATGMILIMANVSGRKYCFAQRDVHIEEHRDGQLIHFIGALLNNPEHEESVDYLSRETSTGGMHFRVMADHFPLDLIWSKSATVLQRSIVDVYWIVDRRKVAAEDHMCLDQALHLLSGRLNAPVYSEEDHVVEFTVEEARVDDEKMFPPVAASADRISTLVPEHEGKPYPVVFGEVKKLPLLNIDTDVATGDRWLVMHDPLQEYSGNAVTQLYDGDSLHGGAPYVEARLADAENDYYWYVDDTAGAGAASSLTVTADVTGHTPSTPGDVIRYLITWFGVPDLFDLASLKRMRTTFASTVLAMAFNQRDGTVLSIIRDRLRRFLPFALLQRGERYVFLPLMWDCDPVRIISTDRAILNVWKAPAETPRDAVANRFVFLRKRSGLRGDHQDSDVFDHENDWWCRESRRRYGERELEVDLGDVQGDTGCYPLQQWWIDTHSKVRVMVGYECSLECAGLRLWDTVRVVDRWNGWDALFKVKGIRRGDGPTVGVDLVSIDDRVEVYDSIPEVTRTYSYPEAVQTFGWGDGLPTDTGMSFGGGVVWNDGLPDTEE